MIRVRGFNLRNESNLKVEKGKKKFFFLEFLERIRFIDILIIVLCDLFVFRIFRVLIG